MDKSEMKNNFVDNFNNLIKEHQIKQADVARGTDIDQTRLTKYANIQYSDFPDVEKLKALSDFFGVSMDYFIEKHEKNADDENDSTNEIETSQEISFNDVIKALFLIDEFCDVGFVEIEDKYLYLSFCDNADGHLHIVNHPTTDDIVYNRENVDDFFVEWSALKKALSTFEDVQYAKEMYNDWKKKQLATWA